MNDNTETAVGFDEAIEAFREAQASFVQGDPRAALALYSQQDDVTLANPLGLPARGPAAVAAVAAGAAAAMKGGSVTGYEEVARFVTGDLGYVVQIERFLIQLDGSLEPRPSSLRATLILRREEGGWRVCHRHADLITAARPASSVLEEAPEDRL